MVSKGVLVAVVALLAGTGVGVAYALSNQPGTGTSSWRLVGQPMIAGAKVTVTYLNASSKQMNVTVAGQTLNSSGQNVLPLFQSGWSNGPGGTISPTIVLTSLPPGNYTLRLFLIDDSGAPVSTVTEIPVTI